MTLSDPFDVLTAEHTVLRRHTQRAVQAAEGRKDALQRIAVETLVAAVRRHLQREDFSLYPLCERLFGGDGGPMQVMRRDHTAVRRALARLDGAISASRPGDLPRHLGDLDRTLNAHLRREERVLFPLTAVHLSEAEAALLVRSLSEGS